MTPETVEKDSPVVEVPENASFGQNLRRLWQNLKAAIFRSGKPTSDRARTQKV